MTRELQDAIGKRLYNLHYLKDEPLVAEPLAPDWEVAGSLMRESFRVLARECIRQMEWARRRIGEQVSHIPDAALCEAVVGPLTLAPEDWKP
jgi:hypothetical protein